MAQVKLIQQHIFMRKVMSQYDCGLYIVDAKRVDLYGLNHFLNNGENTNQIARLLRVINENMSTLKMENGDKIFQNIGIVHIY